MKGQNYCNNKFSLKKVYFLIMKNLYLKLINLRISNIYYFLLNLRYISFSAHEKDIFSILKAKKLSSILRLNRGFELFCL